ncbi:MAG: DUF3365 domain-containing protein [Cyclobacteriaceae bacterium]|nr:DUF3365 domain-containing protein [Cyclobacteriaceae bacterium]
MSAKSTLGKNLQNAIARGGVEHAIAFCNLQAMPLVDSLSHKYHANISRVSTKARNPADRPNDIESQLLEAYSYQWKDSIALKANVQALDEHRYLFTKPILIDNALCLTCHGTLHNGLKEETLEFIKTKYPDDEATGYSLGDLRGMWSIVIDKKEVVQSIE